MMEDLIQVETMELEDDDSEESEVEIPDLPPIVPPGGSGVEEPNGIDKAGDDLVLTDSEPTMERSGDASVTDGAGGLFAGVLFIAAGWLIYRML